ncbi:hypothetical protein WI665_15690 [Vibrio cholerae]
MTEVSIRKSILLPEKGLRAAAGHDDRESYVDTNFGSRYVNGNERAQFCGSAIAAGKLTGGVFKRGSGVG